MSQKTQNIGKGEDGRVGGEKKGLISIAERHRERCVVRHVQKVPPEVHFKS
jgi:hypothetical protein